MGLTSKITRSRREIVHCQNVRLRDSGAFCCYPTLALDYDVLVSDFGGYAVNDLDSKAVFLLPIAFRQDTDV